MDWIKIATNIMDHRKIKALRNQSKGNTLVLLWILMLIEGGKCNRGGYLMLSNSLPYTPETLSMQTGIALPTVQLGLVTFTGMDMIDQVDGAIFIKNWAKYQSEDRLEERREKDRIRQQKHRTKKRESIVKLIPVVEMSRDRHGGTSRDVTNQNRSKSDLNSYCKCTT